MTLTPPEKSYLQEVIVGGHVAINYYISVARSHILYKLHIDLSPSTILPIHQL